MKKIKAAGLDGLPIEFYQTRWEFSKEDMCDLFSNFSIGSLDIERLNYGIITLLPKVKYVNKIQ
jgi:hypothetical protein